MVLVLATITAFSLYAMDDDDADVDDVFYSLQLKMAMTMTGPPSLVLHSFIVTLLSDVGQIGSRMYDDNDDIDVDSNGDAWVRRT